MSEDRPLTDFADASEESADGGQTTADSEEQAADDSEEQTTADSEAQAADDSEEQTAADSEHATAVDSASAIGDAEPATPTYRWQPDGAVCEACGVTTERQWHDDEGFVCPDCKSW